MPANPSKTAKTKKLIRVMSEATVEPIAASKARTILRHAHESAEGFLESFAAVRRDRGAATGTSKDEEQDLTRACLVFAAAGLDSMLKQLIRDALPELVRCDDGVREGLQSFISKQLRGSLDGGESKSGRDFLARILTSESQLDALIEEYIVDLTGSSLQSAEELSRAASALGLNPNLVGIDKGRLKPIFAVRNRIIHELDVNLDAPTRNRESRKRDSMARDANALLEVGEKILRAVETKLGAAV